MKRRILRVRRLGAALTALVFAATSAAPTFAIAAAQTAGATIGDPYTIVDCLLPGATRKLGSRLVIAGRRMPARVPARDCEIRGGEYVSADRSTYASSLEVWKPLAEAGDPKAQTYVGDILVKGVANAPDYTGAAAWYQKAAAQGFGPAMFSLGALYENGAGVPKDRQIAVTWYRKAAGLEAPQFDSVSFAPAPDAALQNVTAELNTERGETAKLREQVRKLQAEVTRKQNEQAAAGNLDADRAALSAERQSLAREREALNAAISGAAGKQTAETTKMRAEAEAKMAALAAQEKALKARESAVAAQEAERTQIAVEREKLAQDRASAKASLQSAAVNSAQESAAAKAAAETMRAEAEAKMAALAMHEQSLKAREAAVAALEAERTQIAADRKNLAQDQAVAKAALQNAETARSQAAAGALAAADKVRAEAEAKLAALSSREQSVKTREGELAAREATFVAKQAELDKIQRELNQRREALAAEPVFATMTQAQKPLAPSAPPQIVMLDPQILETRGEPVIMAASDATSQVISGKVRTSGQALMSLTINGRRTVPTSAGVFGAELPVTATPTSYQIVAVDTAGARSELRFDLRRSAPVAPPSAADRAREIVSRAHLGKFYALLIGNTHYKFGWNELRTPTRDVDEMGQVLREKYGFEVDTLYDATRESIGAALYKLRAKVGENDSVVIYYAGHGAFLPSATGDRGYWIPVDGDKQDPTNWIAADTIHEWVGMLAARKVLVISDSCFSGLLMRSGSAFVEAGKSEDAQLELLRSEAEGRSRTYLTSGRDAPVFDQGGSKGLHSIFAQAMIDSLKANNTVTTGRHLAAQVEQTVLYLSRLATRGTDSQQPDYQPMRTAGHVAGDFIFVPAPQTTLSAQR